jgi:iduronate 2-sulfatase
MKLYKNPKLYRNFIVKYTLIAAVSLTGTFVLHAQEKKKMNVLFILADDLRPNLNCYGDKVAVTPNIDKLGKSGVIFNRAYCQQAVCNPSRASMLTGLRPDEIGVLNLETHFRNKKADLVTLPQAFKNNGYLTVGAGKIFHTLPGEKDLESWSAPVNTYGESNYVLEKNKIGKGAKKAVAESADVADDAYADGKIAEAAIQLLDESTNSGKPFFMAVGFKKPHAPFCAPEKYWNIYKDSKFVIENRGRPVGSPDIAYHAWQELRGYNDIPKQGPIPADKEREIWNGYYACISYVDAQIGKIVDHLEKLGLRENTIIVLWGDHGYHLGEQDLWCKSTNFELDARVPLIIDAPSMRVNGKKSDAIVETVDIYPTLIDLCGIKESNALSGKSLRNILMSPKEKGRNIAFSQFVRPYNAITKGKLTHMGYSLRTEDWRCTYWYDLADNTIIARELYNLKGKKMEEENVSGKPAYAKVESELAGLIEQYKMGKYKK